MGTHSKKIICIGSGISGLYFALKASSFAEIFIYVKNDLIDSNSYHAKGGIAAPIGSHDSTELHIADTLIAGDGLCDEKAVRFMIERSHHCIMDLFNLGVSFSQNDFNEFELAREGGHSNNRILHVKDETGKNIIYQLIKLAKKNEHIHIFEYHYALDFIKENNQIVGVTFLNNQTKLLQDEFSDYTIIATGGAGSLFQNNTNPPSAVGDGYAMAARAGAQLNHMEFVQFHPTLLYQPKNHENILISEALRGAGAILKSQDGKPLMEKYHPLGSLAPRDIVSRSMYLEMQTQHQKYLYLDATHIEKKNLTRNFPYIYTTCLKNGIDISKEMIKVIPAAHYICGGVMTNLKGETSVDRLYAIGEVACTGVHGANRLASNSLLEGIVFAEAAAFDIHSKKDNSMNRETYIYKANISTQKYTLKKDSIQELMWKYLGIVRYREEIRSAIKQLTDFKKLHQIEMKHLGISRAGYEILNMIETALIIAHAAVNRANSIGTHYMHESPKNSHQTLQIETELQE